MADTDEAAAHGDVHDAHEHAIHMPPNSWSPIVLALTLTATFVGFLAGPWLWIVGLGCTVATLYVWFRAARTEFSELPD